MGETFGELPPDKTKLNMKTKKQIKALAATPASGEQTLKRMSKKELRKLEEKALDSMYRKLAEFTTLPLDY